MFPVKEMGVTGPYLVEKSESSRIGMIVFATRWVCPVSSKASLCPEDRLGKLSWTTCIPVLVVPHLLVESACLLRLPSIDARPMIRKSR